MDGNFSAYTKAWQQFLSQARQIRTQSEQAAPRIFISYAWEPSTEALMLLQSRLRNLQQDLLAAGAAHVFLDINHMDGSLTETMRRGIDEADKVLMICTPRYKARIQDEKSNAAYEYRSALSKGSSSPGAVIPLWWSGTRATAIPGDVQNIDAYDFRDTWARAQQLGAGENALLPKLLGLDNDVTSAFTQAWESFRKEAWGDAQAPNILTLLKTVYAEQIENRPKPDQYKLPDIKGRNAQNDTMVTVLYGGEQVNQRNTALLGWQDELWNNAVETIPVYIYLPLLANVRHDGIAEYLKQNFGYSSEDVLSLKEHYRFQFLLDGFEQLLAQTGVRNIIKELNLLSWSAQAVVSSKATSLDQWRIIDSYLQRHGYPSAQVLHLPSLDAEERKLLEGAWRGLRDLSEPLLSAPTTIREEIPALEQSMPAQVNDGTSDAWDSFLADVKKRSQTHAGGLDENTKVCVRLATNESEEVRKRIQILVDDLQKIKSREIQVGNEESMADKAAVLIPICTPAFNAEVQQSGSAAQKMLADALRKQVTSKLQLMPLWFDGDNFASSVPENLWGVLVRDMRDPWFYHHYMATLSEPLGVLPALLDIKISTQAGINYSSLVTQLTLPGPKLLAPLQKQWQASMQTDGMMRPRSGCYVWPDVRTQRDSDEQDGLHDYWQNTVLPRARGDADGDNSAPVYYFVGEPGSGKSTLLWECSDQLWQQLYQHHVVPIRISLSQVEAKSDFVNDYLLNTCGYQPWQIQILKQRYRFAIFLDALDECQNLSVREGLFSQSDVFDWPGVVCITTRINEEPGLKVIDECLSQIGRGAANRRYLCEFTPNQINSYLQARAQHDPALTDGALAKLHAIPGLLDLVSNQLLLFLTVEVLPDLSDTSKRLKRYDLYELFTRKWFSREFSRLIEEGKLVIPSDAGVRFEDALMQFAHEIARKMYISQELKLHDASLSEHAASVLSTVFAHAANAEYLQAIRQASPLRPIGDGYMFIHKSFYEFFIAKLIIVLVEVDKNERAEPAKELLKWRKIQEEPEILYFLFDRWDTVRAELRPLMLALLDRSKNTHTNTTTSANAFTVLNWMNESLLGLNLQNINVSGADASSALLAQSDLRGANFGSASMDQMMLYHAQLEKMKLDSVWLNERFSLNIKKKLHFVHAIASHPSKPWAAIGAASGMILIDVNTGQLPTEIEPPGKPSDFARAAPYSSLYFSYDGESILIIDESDVALLNLQMQRKTSKRLWDAHNKEGIGKDEIRCAAISHTENIFLVGTEGGKIQAYAYTDTSIEKQKEFTRFCEQPTGLIPDSSKIVDSSKIYALALSQDGKQFISLSINELIVWDFASGEEEFRLPCKDGVFSCSMYYDAANKRAFFGGQKGLCMWDIEKGVILKNITKDAQERSVRSFSYNIAKQEIAFSFHKSNAIMLWDIRSKSLIGKPLAAQAKNSLTQKGSVECLAFADTGTLISGHDDSTVYCWNMASTPVASQPFSGHGSAVKTVLFTGDRRFVITFGENADCYVWHTNTGRLSHRIALSKRPEDKARCIAVHPDGKRLVAGNQKGEIQYWNLETGQTISKPFAQPEPIQDAHHKHVEEVAFSPDGKYLLSSGAALFMWEVDAECTHKEPIALATAQNFNKGGVYTRLRFSPDGAWLSAVFDEGPKKTLIWPLQDGLIIDTCSTLYGTTITAFCKNDRQFISASDNGTNFDLCLLPENFKNQFDFKAVILNQLSMSYKHHRHYYTGIMTTSSDMKLMAASFSGGYLHLFLLDSKQSLGLGEIKWNAGVTAMAFMPVLKEFDEKQIAYLLVAGDATGVMCAWRIDITPEYKASIIWANKSELMNLNVQGVTLQHADLNDALRGTLMKYGAKEKSAEEDNGVLELSPGINQAVATALYVKPVVTAYKQAAQAKDTEDNSTKSLGQGPVKSMQTGSSKQGKKSGCCNVS